jgi:hypothetical protein
LSRRLVFPAAASVLLSACGLFASPGDYPDLDASTDDASSSRLDATVASDAAHNREAAAELDAAGSGDAGVEGDASMGVDAGNAVDASDAGGLLDAGASPTKTIFISSALYDGNLGGLAGADQKCQSLATAARLPGTYRAWLSSSTTSAASRLNHSKVPYVLVDGTRVADNWTDLTDNVLQHAITLTEKGTPPHSGTAATGCGATGSPLAYTFTDGVGNTATGLLGCDDWTATTNPAGSCWGDATQTGSSWSHWCVGGKCSWTAALYCLEQ